MSEIETLGILEEIGALVSDRLQVVSYKWLSRNFLVSSNVAKKLLQEFVENHGHGLEVVYTVAGWLKKTPPTYHIRLVPAPKLAEAKEDFDDNCSVQVYSVQASIPKDPAAIWNAEFIQAEELFKQPFAVDNCLRDNRFCGVSNSLVKRNAEGAPLAIAAPHTKGDGNPGLATGKSANQTGSIQPQQKKLQQSSPKLAVQSSNVTSAGTENKGSNILDLQNKETSEKVKTSLPATKKKGQSDKTAAATGGSLTNFWGRAATRSKSTNSSAEDKTAAQNNDSADTQICAREALETASSDDDGPDVNFKRASNGDGGKKRRIVLDDSDDDDDYGNAVNLASPDPPKGQSFQDSKQKNRTLDREKNTLNFDEQEECKSKVKREKGVDVEVNNLTKNSTTAKAGKISASEEIQAKTADVVCHKNKAAAGPPSSPKKRKVMKTRIDERGREVTEVVWEDEETDTKDVDAGKSTDIPKNPNGHPVKVEDNAATNPVNRPAIVKKSPANSAPSHTAGKPGSKKGASTKDPKQGNILSFFKRA